MAFFSILLMVLAFKAQAHVDVGCGAGEECPAASQVKPLAGRAMLQKHNQAKLAQERGRSMTAKSNATDEFVTPQDLMNCPGEIAYTTQCMTTSTYDLILDRIRTVMDDELDAACGAEHCEQADWAGCVLRMAGHDFMDYKDGQGGADACTDMSDPDNGGLAACLSQGEFGFSLNSIYPEFCETVSLADFVVIAAQAVMSHSATPGRPQGSLGGELKQNFRFGRTTLTGDACKSATHWHENPLLPNPAGGCSEVDRVFVTNMGLSWEGATALMGVHSLGRAKIENSGFDGYWDTPEHSRTFNNHYYVAIIATGWCPELAVGGNPDKNQWKRCDIGTDKFSHKEMMLNTDMCLAFTDSVGGPLIAGEQASDCCTWVHTNVGGVTKPIVDGYEFGFDMTDVVANNNNSFCNVQCGDTFVDGEGQGREWGMDCHLDVIPQASSEKLACCHLHPEGGKAKDCFTPGLGDPDLAPADPKTMPAVEFVRAFAADEMVWISAFLTAWWKATENGFENSLQSLVGICEGGTR